jgi:hypothetical protein
VDLAASILDVVRLRLSCSLQAEAVGRWTLAAEMWEVTRSARISLDNI